MKRKFLILIAALATLTTSAQEQEGTREKSTPFLESVSIGIDLVGPIRRVMSDRGEYQAFVQAHIKGYFLPVIEVGYGTADRYDAETNTSYKTKAPFGRIGCDFNILKNRHDVYRLTAGVRYGLTSFDYDTTTPDDEKLTSFTTVTEKCTLQWAEITFGADAKVWGPLHMGWSLRYRRKLSRSAYTAIPLYAPGYGKGSEDSRWMALYNISLQF